MGWTGHSPVNAHRRSTCQRTSLSSLWKNPTVFGRSVDALPLAWPVSTPSSFDPDCDGDDMTAAGLLDDIAESGGLQSQLRWRRRRLHRDDGNGSSFTRARVSQSESRVWTQSASCAREITDAEECWSMRCLLAQDPAAGTTLGPGEAGWVNSRHLGNRKVQRVCLQCCVTVLAKERRGDARLHDRRHVSGGPPVLIGRASPAGVNPS